MGPQVGTPEKIQKARTILSRMEGNTSFSNPNPSLAEVAAATDALENAYDLALDGSKSAKIQMRQCESVFIGFMKMLASYVLIASKGEEHIIASSGFEVKRENKTPVAPGNPSNVHGAATNRPGEVIVRWSKAAAARLYTVQIRDDGTTWRDCGLTSKTRMVVSGLSSGSKPLFRIAALGPAGQSGWSDPGAVRVD